MLLFLLTMSILLVIGVVGQGSLSGPPSNAQQICAECSCTEHARRETLTDRCFELVADVCQWDPRQVSTRDAWVSPTRSRIDREWPFCEGFTATSKPDVSIAAYIRIELWVRRNCNALPCYPRSEDEDAIDWVIRTEDEATAREEL